MKSSGSSSNSTNNQTAAPRDLRQVPLHEETSRRARELWEGYGRPEGRDEAIWLEAERQILGTDAKARAAEQGNGTVSTANYAAATSQANTAGAHRVGTPSGQMKRGR